jgi:predicted transcriptional regulator
MKAVSNEVRLDILYSLYEKPKTWTELIFELKINPKSLRDHISYLRKSGLIKKREPVGFEVTDAAKAFIEYSLHDIIETARKAAKTAQK